MDEVAPGLFVGSCKAIGEREALPRHGITTLVVLTHTDPGDKISSDVDVVQVPMMDGPQNSKTAFAAAVTEVQQRLANDESVAVCCSAGASRSPAVAATALARHTDTHLTDALQQVASRRAEVAPHDALIRQAVSVYTDSRRDAKSDLDT